MMTAGGKSCHGAGAKVEERSDEIPQWRDKKCDKRLTHIVRVALNPTPKTGCDSFSRIIL